MSNDHVAKLAATIEVLTGAVQFLLAERVNAQAETSHGDLLRVLQRSLSAPGGREDVLLGRTAIARADLALWMPIVATTLVDGVRVQLGRPPEAVTHIAPRPVRPGSEVAERLGGEGARAAPHAEPGRSVA